MTTTEIIQFATDNIGRAVVINFFNAEYHWRHYRIESVTEQAVAVTSMADDEGNQRNGFFTWMNVASIIDISLRT